MWAILVVMMEALAWAQPTSPSELCMRLIEWQFHGYIKVARRKREPDAVRFPTKNGKIWRSKHQFATKLRHCWRLICWERVATEQSALAEYIAKNVGIFWQSIWKKTVLCRLAQVKCIYALWYWKQARGDSLDSTFTVPHCYSAGLAYKYIFVQSTLFSKPSG